jgi:hypothetical protein
MALTGHQLLRHYPGLRTYSRLVFLFSLLFSLPLATVTILLELRHGAAALDMLGAVAVVLAMVRTFAWILFLKRPLASAGRCQDRDPGATGLTECELLELLAALTRMPSLGFSRENGAEQIGHTV